MLLGAFGGPGPEGFAASHHWRLAIAYLVGLAQVAGGLAIVSGILFRRGAASLLIVILGAIFLVHLPHGFDVSNGGGGVVLHQVLVEVRVLFSGPRRQSLLGVLPPSRPKLSSKQ